MVPATVHVWTASADRGLAEDWSAELPLDLVESLRRLPEPAWRRRTVQQALRRNVFAEHIGTSMRDLVLAYAPGGPIAPPSEHLLVSATHFDDLTALAVADEGIGLGVDLEPRFEEDWREALDMVLTDSELVELGAIPEAGQASRYFELWTLKEAVMKALGDGLSDRGPASLEIMMVNGAPTLASIDNRQPSEPWGLWSGPIGPSVCSIALRGIPAIEPVFSDWPG